MYSAPDRWIGQLLDGRYRIERVIERGGMGTVYLAQAERIQREVAVKIVSARPQAGQNDLRRLAREARAVNLIGHPNIVDVIDFGWIDERAAFLVMELLVGESLDARLATVRRLPLEHTCTILTQVAYALEAAHQRGVVHRDVKPGNVFLVQTKVRADVVKVLDFGVASLREVDGRSSDLDLADDKIIGTPAYLAPEQARGKSTVDQRADVFALGITMYTMLCGEPPFVAETPIDTLLRILNDEHVPPSQRTELELPREVDALIDEALRKEPAERLPTASEFRRRLVGLRQLLDHPTRRREERIELPVRRQFGAWVTNQRGRAVVELSGVIDERADLQALDMRIGGEILHLKLGRVTRINSQGYQRWVSWLRRVRESGRQVVCHECSPVVVRQASMASGFIEPNEIATIYAPYFCENCDIEHLALLSSDAIRRGEFEGPMCTSCNTNMQFDEVAQTYFLCVFGS
ncbi:MAG: serine/threonine protein kinase [Myxococcales bacterium]|nr:serine/threonine protein kinase [Myxococcales bacterium]